MQQLSQSKLVSGLIELVESKLKSELSASERAELNRQLNELITSVTHGQREADKKRVTILLSDLRGFTSVSEKYTALEIMEVLNRYLARMCEIIIEHDGIIDKFMGDAIMVLFDKESEQQSSVEQAIACAIEMQLAMDELNEENRANGFEPLYMGIGINTGEVVAGYLGSSLHSEYTVIGDQVNLASRVEAHSLRGQILLSENSYRLAREHIEIGNVNVVNVKGKREPVRMFELRSINRPKLLTTPVREIRGGPRVDVDLPIKFQILREKDVLPEIYRGGIRDIGYGGMYMQSPVAIEAFADIKATISLSMMSGELTDIYAKVLRVNRLDEGIYECRVEFTTVDPPAQQAIKDFVDSVVELNRKH